MSNSLVEIKKYLATDDLKQTVNDGYIEMIFKLHPKVKPSAIIEHINAVQLSGANPHKKQVYFTSYFSKKLGHSIGTTVFSYRFFEDVSNQIPTFEGCTCVIDVGDYFDPEKGESIKALRATAKGERKGRKPLEFVAWYPEFVQRDYNGKVQSTWKSMPHLMLRKCAIAGALRSLFPETVGTFLIEEEVNKGYDEDAEKIAKMENDIDAAAKEVVIEEKIIADIKTKPTKTKLVERIIELAKVITDGMKKDAKIQWMNDVLEVDNFGRLEKKKVDELQDLVAKLEKIKSEPIVMTDQNFTVKDIPFSEETKCI